MKKVYIITSTRAEFGLLNRLAQGLSRRSDVECKVVVTGSHLSDAHGHTVDEVEREFGSSTIRIPILESGDDALAVGKTMANAIIRFTSFFQQERPDMIVVLGDRYEILAVAIAASVSLVPIAHLYGGETTEGAMDEAFRHSITKMSFLHFTATEDYRRRVIQLGENPENVYSVGSTGLENIRSIELISKQDLEEYLGFPLGKDYAVGTFHPVTLEHGTAEEQCDAVIRACAGFSDVTFLFTKANADIEGEKINHYMESAARRYDNIHLVSSLGYRRYSSAVSGSRFVIGKSSSGIVEAPGFGFSTINIGDRQKGRIQADSIINCDPDEQQIEYAIRKALHMDCSKVINPYEGDHPSKRMEEIICDYLIHDKIDLKKPFYDLI